MKKSIFTAALLLLAGCSSALVRTGYDRPPESFAVDSSCKVAVKSNVGSLKDRKTIGMIKATETGFALDCDEQHVIQVFVREACYTHANVVNVLTEAHPDVWSSCYRAHAELISTSETVHSDPKFSAYVDGIAGTVPTSKQ